LRKLLIAILLLSLTAACGKRETTELAASPSAAKSWADVEKAARGKTVRFMLWQGDPLINAYLKNFIAPQLLQRYGVEVQFVAGQGNEIIASLMSAKEAKSAPAVDMIWINGETFYQLRQIDALHGPFLDSLPSSSNIDLENRFIKYDFQQPVDGFEAPWGNVQMVLIHDNVRVPAPPRNRAELLTWVRANPGRFTFDNSFTGMTLLKSWMIDIAGGEAELAGPFDEAKYRKHSAALWAYIRELRPHLWRRGRTFPEGVAQLHKMFTNGEVDFTMSNNDGEVDNKVLQGLFPKSSRGYVLDGGTIQNSHFLGIPKGSAQVDAALVTINFMLSPEAQLEKLKPEVWGDGTILKLELLPAEWRTRFDGLPKRQYGPRREDIESRALMELAPEYMLRIYEDFRSEIIAK